MWDIFEKLVVKLDKMDFSENCPRVKRWDANAPYPKTYNWKVAS